MTGTPQGGADRRRYQRLTTDRGIAGQATVHVPCRVVGLTDESLTLQVPVRPPVGTRCEVVLSAGELRGRVQSLTAPLGPEGPFHVLVELSMRPVSTSGRFEGELQMRIPLRLRNLSRGGAGILTAAPLAPGSVHEFLIELGGEAFVSRAQVRRCRPAERVGDSEIGIEFTEMSARDVSRLEHDLAAHDVSPAPIVKGNA